MKVESLPLARLFRSGGPVTLWVDRSGPGSYVVEDGLKPSGREARQHVLLKTVKAGHGFEPVNGLDPPGGLPWVDIGPDGALSLPLGDQFGEVPHVTELKVADVIAQTV